MERSSFVLRKPVFFLFVGAGIFLFITTGFLYKEKRTVEKQYKQLIIQNDSIMSVNILLTDSLRQQATRFLPKKSLALKSGLEK